MRMLHRASIYGADTHPGILTRRDLQMDHVVPLARGGSHTYGNLRPAHGHCNRRKHAKLMSELVS